MPQATASKRATVLDHPLVAHHLTQLRDQATRAAEFRTLVDSLTSALVHEATADLHTVGTTVTTPVGPAAGAKLAERVGVVPILRAGLGMTEPVLRMLPGAEVWHLGLYRNEETLEPVEYYQKLPPGKPVDVALVIDPMLATGGSATAALAAVERWGAPRIKLLTLISAPEGVARVEAEHPQVQIYTCVIDHHLDERGYIVPGLGDAGDRLFNTLGE